jgi:hypothetical protein
MSVKTMAAITAANGAIVAFSDTQANLKSDPPLAAVPAVTETASCSWIEHYIDDSGSLQRLTRTERCFNIYVASQSGGGDHSGDGSAASPFCDLNSVREKLDCLQSKLFCAGVIMQVVVSGVIDYPAGLLHRRGVIYDFTYASVEAPINKFDLIDSGRTRVVIKGLSADRRAIYRSMNNAVFNQCTFSGSAESHADMWQHGGLSLAFDGCRFYGDGISRGKWENITVAESSVEAVNSPSIANCHNSFISNVQLSSYFDSINQMDKYFVAGTCEYTSFANCSTVLECSFDADDFDETTVKIFTACGFYRNLNSLFDNCDAATAGVSAPAEISFASCGFHANTGSAFSNVSTFTRKIFISDGTDENIFGDFVCDI